MHHDSGPIEQAIFIFAIASMTILFWKGIGIAIVFTFT